MKKNIIHIFGNNSFLIDREKNGLIKIFKQKYGDDSIEFFSLENTDLYSEYINSITSVSMFYEKRMFVFSGGKKEKKSQNENLKDFGDLLEKNIDKISENDFLLFYNLTKTEDKLIKFLKKIADNREKKFSYSIDEWEKYSKLSTQNIKKVLNYYEQNEKLRDKGTENPLLANNIFQTLFNLSILEEENIQITNEIIENFCNSFEGANNFLFIDAILNNDIKTAHKILNRITNNINYKNLNIFIGGIIGILRKYIYIIKLKQLGFSINEISKILDGISEFMVKKAYNCKISHKKISKIYQKIIESNIAYKSGKGMKENILGQLFEIDTSLLELKK